MKGSRSPHEKFPEGASRVSFQVGEEDLCFKGNGNALPVLLWKPCLTLPGTWGGPPCVGRQACHVISDAIPFANCGVHPSWPGVACAREAWSTFDMLCLLCERMFNDYL